MASSFKGGWKPGLRTIERDVGGGPDLPLDQRLQAGTASANKHRQTLDGGPELPINRGNVRSTRVQRARVK
jgi:hypothetical protein